MLGSGAVIVMDDSRDMVESLVRPSHFYMHESCGPGARRAAKARAGWARGAPHPTRPGPRGRSRALDNGPFNIMGRTICALGDRGSHACARHGQAFRHEFSPRYIEPPAVAGHLRFRLGDLRKARSRLKLNWTVKGGGCRGQHGHACCCRKVGHHFPISAITKLSIAANCRMCLVDIEKRTKPIPACATPVTRA